MHQKKTYKVNLKQLNVKNTAEEKNGVFECIFSRGITFISSHRRHHRILAHCDRNFITRKGFLMCVQNFWSAIQKKGHLQCEHTIFTVIKIYTLFCSFVRWA